MDQGRIEAILHFYETLTPERVRDFGFYYSDDAYFKDPFNEVQGLEDIRRIFARMFQQVIDPRFVVREKVGDARGLFLVWDMRFRMKSWKPRQQQIIRGVSHLRFGEDDKVTYHRDYWDTGEELYGKLPLIGGAVRFLRRAIG
ncbi:MAG: nuclear transport factor 2 family protein [Prolixibacteraceae bacterium]|nr:nuclear transport factor 2 family protein [Burkholderiales bacterium]